MGVAFVNFEIILSAIVAFAAAWFGFTWAYKNTRRLKTAELILQITSIEFSNARIEMHSELEAQSGNLVNLANPDVKSHEKLRQNIFNIFNTYEVVCALRAGDDIDHHLFKEHLLPIIEKDYIAIDGFFAEVEKHQNGDGRDLSRPFYPCIARNVRRDRLPTR